MTQHRCSYTTTPTQVLRFDERYCASTYYPEPEPIALRPVGPESERCQWAAIVVRPSKPRHGFVRRAIRRPSYATRHRSRQRRLYL